MFPLSDFNVVCCALATVSAAVGYQYSRKTAKRNGPSFLGRKMRRFSTSSTSSETTLVGDADITYSKPTENAYDDTEPGSLKRKLREVEVESENSTPDDIEREPSQERSSTPRKKLRIGTPETEEDGDYILIKVEEASPEPPESPVEVTPPPIPASQEPQASAETLAEGEKSGLSNVEIPQKAPEASPSSPVLPSAFTVPSYKPCTGFSAFATSSTSPFAASSSSSKQPAWRTASSRSFNPLDPLSSIVPISEAPAQPLADVDQPAPNADDALAAQPHTKKSQTNLTGEEDEEVITELKGAKLFVKRGAKDFADGMFGHVKYLSHRETKEERLVFRREHVWKVSMSVRLRPTVRCTFDEDQGILRFTLKEAIDGEMDEQRQEVVVYAIKRGKMPKSDFATFAQQVVASSHLPQAPSNAA